MAKLSKKTFPRWKPRSSGKVYCSPACGRGCTHAEFKRATVQAAKLVKRLGEGWKPRVWENLGWFSEAISWCGNMRVGVRRHSGRGRRRGNSSLPSGPVEYYAYFAGKWQGVGDTPQAAVQAARQEAREEYLRITVLLDGLCR